MARFKVGEIVRLKSGGPDMTIADRDIGLVHCRWFDSGNEARDAWFETETLEFADDGFYEDEPIDLTDIELDALVAGSDYYKDGHY